MNSSDPAHADDFRQPAVRGSLSGGSASARRDARPRPNTVSTTAERLFAEPYDFDFYQAVCLLEQLYPDRRPVGWHYPPGSEVVRFSAHQSTSFPASALYDLKPPGEADQPARMTVCFMGLTGSNGVLPRHYTELLLRLERESKATGQRALRDFLDLFNHRLISLLFRSWAKYRPYVAYARGAYNWDEPDAFSTSLYSLVGLGLPSTRRRLSVGVWTHTAGRMQPRTLAQVDDAGLLYYAGLLAQRPRNAANLEALLSDFFKIPTRVVQFQGQWLQLEPEIRSRLGLADGNSQLGRNAVVGQRVWDRQHKVRLRIGPLSYAQFVDFLPDPEPAPRRKMFFLLSHVARLFAGPELDLDVQLTLRRDEVPACHLDGDTTPGPRLGWNTWLATDTVDHDAEDAVFDVDERRWLANSNDAGQPATLQSA